MITRHRYRVRLPSTSRRAQSTDTCHKLGIAHRYGVQACGVNHAWRDGVRLSIDVACRLKHVNTCVIDASTDALPCQVFATIKSAHADLT